MSWRQYNEEEPFLLEQVKLSTERMEARVIWMIAQLTSVFVNMYRREGSPPYSVSEFIPKWAGEELSDEEEWDIMNSKFEAYNARVRELGG